MNAAPVAAANSRLRKIVRSSIGARWRRSISTNSGSRTTPATIPAIVNGSPQPLRPAAREPEDQAGEPDDEHQHARARRSRARGPAGPARAGQPAQIEPSSGERHVEPEHPVPRDRHQRAAEHRPDHEPDRRDHRVRAHRQPELLARERVGDQRGGVGEQERAADPLHDAPQDQLGPAGGEAGAQRRQPEQHEPST